MAIRLHILCLISLIFLYSCSPQKRLNRLIKKHPHLTEVSIDTIKVRDTIYIENYDTTVLSSIIKHDTTIIVNNDRTFARYYYDTLRQEIYHEVECKSDTIIREHEITTEKLINPEGDSIHWKEWLHIGLMVLVASMVWYFAKRRKKD